MVDGMVDGLSSRGAGGEEISDGLAVAAFVLCFFAEGGVASMASQLCPKRLR